MHRPQTHRSVCCSFPSRPSLVSWTWHLVHCALEANSAVGDDCKYLGSVQPPTCPATGPRTGNCVFSSFTCTKERAGAPAGARDGASSEQRRSQQLDLQNARSFRDGSIVAFKDRSVRLSLDARQPWLAWTRRSSDCPVPTLSCPLPSRSICMQARASRRPPNRPLHGAWHQFHLFTTVASSIGAIGCTTTVVVG